MKLFWIGLGGALGTIARYLMDGWVQGRLGPAFPFGTLAVNAAGSFLIGLVMQLALAMGAAQSTLRLALTIGFLGGFTTYSSFNYETLNYFRNQAYWMAGLNLAATVLACLAAGVLGLWGGRLLGPR